MEVGDLLLSLKDLESIRIHVQCYMSSPNSMIGNQPACNKGRDAAIKTLC